jgi:hypothetical protein
MAAAMVTVGAVELRGTDGSSSESVLAIAALVLVILTAVLAARFR